jgi:AraC-like DNA-binding protein
MEQVILISSFLIPLVLSLVILFNSANDKHKITLGLSMLNAAAVFLANYFYFIQNIEVYVYLHSLHVALVLFIYPSLFIYLKQLTGNYKKNNKTYLHLLPGILFFLLYVFFFDIQFNINAKISFLSNYRDNSFNIDPEFIFVEWIRIINVAIIIGQVIGYSLAIFKTSRKFHLKLKNELSNAEDFQIKWLVWFNIALIAIAVLSVLFYVVNPFDDSNNYLLIFSMFSMSIFIWLIGIWGNAQKTITLPAKTNYNNISYDQNDLCILYEELLHTIKKKKLYLSPDLTLSGLATNLGTNRTYISQAINSVGKMNFNSFINKFRIEEAKNILERNPQIKQDALANQVGFGSAISLQRALVKETGLNYLEWKNKKVASK